MPSSNAEQIISSYKVATKVYEVKRDVRSDIRKNSKTEKPINGCYFECEHCGEAFLGYEASDEARKFQSKKAEK